MAILGPRVAYRQQVSKAPSLAHQEKREIHNPPSPQPILQDEIFEEQESRADKEATTPTSISLSSPYEVVMPPPLFVVDDFQQFQVHIKQVANVLQIPLEESKNHNISCCTFYSRQHAPELCYLSMRCFWIQQSQFLADPSNNTAKL